MESLVRILMLVRRGHLLRMPHSIPGYSSYQVSLLVALGLQTKTSANKALQRTRNDRAAELRRYGETEIMNRLSIYIGMLVLAGYSTGCVDCSQGVGKPGKLTKTRPRAASIDILDFGKDQDVLLTSLGGARHDFRWQEKIDDKSDTYHLTVLVRCDRRAVLYIARVLSEAHEAWMERFSTPASINSDVGPFSFRVCVGGRSVQGHIPDVGTEVFECLRQEVYVVSGMGLADAILLAHRAERLATAGDKPTAALMYEEAVKGVVSWAEKYYAPMFSRFLMIVEFVEGYAYGELGPAVVLPQDPLQKHRVAFQRLMKLYLINSLDPRDSVIVVIPRHPGNDPAYVHSAERFPADARRFLVEHRSQTKQRSPRINGQ